MIDFPANPVEGQTFVAAGVVYTFNGQGWTTAAGGIVGGDFGVLISDIAPDVTGTSYLWWESDTGMLYVLYNDGTSEQWVQINAHPPGGDGINAATGDERYVNTVGDTMTGPLFMPADPVEPLEVATKQYVDANIGGGGTGDWLDQESGDARYVNLSGDIMTGALVLSGDPQAPMESATKQYVDNQITNNGGISLPTADGRYVNVSGDTMTGQLVLPADPTQPLQAATKKYVDARSISPADADARYVNVDGDTMTGALLLNGDPTNLLQAATKQYVDAKGGLNAEAGDLRYVNLTGDTMTGALVLPADPTLPLEAATKQYVDALIDEAEGLDEDNFVNVAGDTMTGQLNVPVTPIDPANATSKQYVDTQVAAAASAGIDEATADERYVDVAGDTMTGQLILAADPVLPLEAVTKQYVDANSLSQSEADALYLSQTEADALYVNVSGDTMTGTLVLSGAPVADMDAVNKAYVDAAVAGSLDQTEADGRYVNITGDTMTGALNLPQGLGLRFIDPSTGLAGSNNYVGINVFGEQKFFVTTDHALFAVPLHLFEGGSPANVQISFGAALNNGLWGTSSEFYVTIAGTNRLSFLAATIVASVPIVLPADPVAAMEAATKQYVDAQVGSGLSPSEANALYVNIAGDTMTGPLVLPANPVQSMEAATKLYVDQNTLNQAEADALYVNIAGDTMTGQLVLPDDPVTAMQAATKQYVDAQVASNLDMATADGRYVNIAGDTMTGPLQLPINGDLANVSLQLGAATNGFNGSGSTITTVVNGAESAQFAPGVWHVYVPIMEYNAPTDPLHLTNKAYVDAQVATALDQTESDARYVNVSGDTMTGGLILWGAPSVMNEAANKGYVDDNFVNISGEIMTGFLTLHLDPVENMHAATKQYVDIAVAAGGGGSGGGIDLPTADARYVNLAGDSMTGALYLQYDVPEVILYSEGGDATIQATANGDFSSADLNLYSIDGPAGILLSARHGFTRRLQIDSNGAPRWFWDFGDDTPETGNSTGSNFKLFRFLDTGSMQPVIEIERATGLIKFNGVPFDPSGGMGDYLPLEGGTLTGPLSINCTMPYLSLEQSMDGTDAMVTSRNHQGWNRWSIILGNRDLETGGNTGNNFALYPHNDTGVIAVAPSLFFDRVSGLGTVLADPVAPLGIATKGYVDTAVAAGGGGSGDYLPLTGGVLTGNLYIDKHSPLLVLNAPDTSTPKEIIGGVGGQGQWYLRLGDTGGNFELGRFDALGVGNLTSILIGTTGVMTFVGHADFQNTVEMSGDATVAGKLTLGSDPLVPLHAATKQYVDAQVAAGGGGGGIGDAPSDDRLYGRTNGIWSRVISVYGDTMLGVLQLESALHVEGTSYLNNVNIVGDAAGSGHIMMIRNGNIPARIYGTALSAAEADFHRWDITLGNTEPETVDDGSNFEIASWNDLATVRTIVLAIDRLSGLATVKAPPVAPLGIATKQYVDSAIASGGTFVDAPIDGKQYGRQDAAWTEVVPGGGGAYLPLAGGTLTGPLHLPAGEGNSPMLGFDVGGVTGFSVSADLLTLGNLNFIHTNRVIATIRAEAFVVREQILSTQGAQDDGSWAPSAPGYAFLGSMNSGMFLEPGSVSIGFATGGTERLGISTSMITAKVPVSITKAELETARIYGKFSISERWDITLGNEEVDNNGGSSTGSAFEIAAYHDNSNTRHIALKFERLSALGTVFGDPVAPLGIATKQYVDAQVAAGGGGGGGAYLPLTGGTMTGDIIMTNWDSQISLMPGGNQTKTALHFGTPGTGIFGGAFDVKIAAEGMHVASFAKSYVAFHFPVELPTANPTDANHATHKAYVDAAIAAAGGGGTGGAYLPLTGGTLSGPGNLLINGELNVIGYANFGHIGADDITVDGQNDFSEGGKIKLGKWAADRNTRIYGQSMGYNRWDITLGNEDTETPLANNGSAYELAAYDDVGVRTVALKFARATKLGTVFADPVDPLGIATKQYVDMRGGGGGASIIAADAKPVGAAPNTLWWDSRVGKLFINYQDANTLQFVEAVKPPDIEEAGGVEEAPIDASDLPYARRNRRWVRVPMKGFLWGLDPFASNTANPLRLPEGDPFLQMSEGFSIMPGEATDTWGRLLMKCGHGWKGMGPFEEGRQGQGGHWASNGDYTILPDQWYRVYLVGKDNYECDVLFTLEEFWQPPVGFTAYRRIGMVKTKSNASGFRSFHAGGQGINYWYNPPMDVKLTAQTGAPMLNHMISAPAIFGAEAFGTITLETGAAPGAHLIYPSDQIFEAPPSSLSDAGDQYWTISAGANTRTTTQWDMPTYLPTLPRNQSSVNSMHSTMNPDVVRIFTRGWIDPRGADKDQD
jgi:hypothetical protein